MNPEKIRVFITVKTYPTLSAKYDELVCTAGITEKGKWIRIYPVPFRKLQWKNQYTKYQWIELDVIRNTDDFRLESHKPIDRGQSINIKEKVEHWEDKKNIIFQETIFTNMKELIANAKNQKMHTSLAIFKPKEIVDFKIEPTEREWDAQKIKQIEEESRQLNLFDSDQNSYEIFQRVKKLPYKFSYSFIDEKDTKSTLMIEDWELGALYWKYENEQEAIQKVKQKFFNELKQKDLYLFLGTTKKFHNISPNPFIIIGVFYPPLTNQMSLL